MSVVTKRKLRDNDPIPSSKNVIERLSPLAEWYRVNKPSVNRIAIDPRDWPRVQKMADDPKDSAIVRHMDGYPVYGKFELYVPKHEQIAAGLGVAECPPAS